MSPSTTKTSNTTLPTLLRKYENSSSTKLFISNNSFSSTTKKRRIRQAAAASADSSSTAINNYKNITSKNNVATNLTVMITTSSISKFTLLPYLLTSTSKSADIDYDASNPRSPFSFRTNDLYERYKPEVGLRTALMLGSMLLGIILYLLWKNRCRCLLRGGDANNSDDYDLEYWLKHVDKQKLAQKNHYAAMFNPQLPDAETNPKQATAAWILEHRKIWTNMHRQRNNNTIAHRNHTDLIGLDLITRSSTPFLNKNVDKNQNPNSRNILIGKLMNPFRRLTNRNSTTLSKNQHKRLYNSSRAKTQLFEELDTKTQLLINYARVDAIDAISNVKFSRLHDFMLYSNLNNGAITNNSQNSRQKSKPPKQNMSNSSSKTNNNNMFSNSQLIEDGSQITNSKNVFEDLSSKESSQIIQNFLINMLIMNRKRRHSWPRSRYDHLQMHNFNREIRMLYYHHQQRHQEQCSQSQQQQLSSQQDDVDIFDLDQITNITITPTTNEPTTSNRGAAASISTTNHKNTTNNTNNSNLNNNINSNNNSILNSLYK